MLCTCIPPFLHFSTFHTKAWAFLPYCFLWLDIHVYCLLAFCSASHHITSHTLVTWAQSQFHIMLRFNPACGLAKGHYSLFTILVMLHISCILSSTIFLCSISCWITHYHHTSSVTISLCFYLAFCCITSPVVGLALLKGYHYSACILLHVTHHHDLWVRAIDPHGMYESTLGFWLHLIDTSHVW